MLVTGELVFNINSSAFTFSMGSSVDLAGRTRKSGSSWKGVKKSEAPSCFPIGPSSFWLGQQNWSAIQGSLHLTWQSVFIRDDTYLPLVMPVIPPPSLLLAQVGVRQGTVVLALVMSASSENPSLHFIVHPLPPSPWTGWTTLPLWLLAVSLALPQFS